MESLIPGGYYHIFNQSVGHELFFKNKANYQYFLNLIKKYVVNNMNILGYCLMPDHFHLIVQIKEFEDLTLDKKLSNKDWDENNTGKYLSRQFANLFNAYAQAYNNYYHRRGSLFKNRFKRKRIRTEDYLKKLVCYIHLNPVMADLCNTPAEWVYSSYNSYIHLQKNQLLKEII